ncbi:hypothetical protein FOZ60_010063 [Perkinsus olseni]|uniref:Uncharacterized protein n=1 Tax=Perkinsus olseni TaxID=32597 RepID=A0A7J6NG47_PEROL|nr:hypothetical protein FOZ60_010063 [Perkinsus olseni]
MVIPSGKTEAYHNVQADDTNDHVMAHYYNTTLLRILLDKNNPNPHEVFNGSITSSIENLTTTSLLQHHHHHDDDRLMKVHNSSSYIVSSSSSEAWRLRLFRIVRKTARRTLGTARREEQNDEENNNNNNLIKKDENNDDEEMASSSSSVKELRPSVKQRRNEFERGLFSSQTAVSQQYDNTPIQARFKRYDGDDDRSMDDVGISRIIIGNKNSGNTDCSESMREKVISLERSLEELKKRIREQDGIKKEMMVETIRALASEANEVRVMANSLKNLVLKQRDECLNMYHYIEILESKLMVNNMLCKEVNRHPAGVILFPKKVINPIKYKLLLSTHHDGDDGVVVDGGKTEDTDGIEEEELKSNDTLQQQQQQLL